MAAQEAQQPQNMEQLEQQTQDESLKKVINEIKELSDGNDKKENDKVELDAILTNEFANKLDANTAQILLEELNKYQIPEGGSAPEGYNALKNFLEMKANDNPIKEKNTITDVDNKATVNNLSENQTNLINTTISTYFTEKNGNQNNGNYIDITKIPEDIPEYQNIKDTLANIKTILEHPTKENIQKLQQFIYNNLDGDLKNKYLDDNKDKKIKSNTDKDGNIIWDGSYGKSTNENLNAFLSNTKDYIKDYQEGKDVADKHTQKANEIEQQKIEEQRNRVSKENAEINADNINVTLRGKWKERDESRLQAEKQQISDKLNSYVQLREYLPKNVQEILCKTRAALESTSQVNDKGDPVSEEVFALENKLNELGFMPKEANDGNNGVDGKFGNKTYDALINCIETSLKNSAEIKADKVTVELRGIYKNLKGDALKEHIKATADELNCYREKRDILTNSQKKILILTKAALESTSDSEDKSDAVLTLENELNNLGFMPKEATDGNNGVDGKFGDKTYNAILACLDGQKPQFVKGLDGEISTEAEDNNKENNTQVKENTKSNTENTKNNPEKPKQGRKRMTLAEFFNKLQGFEWEKGAGLQNIINFFNLLLGNTSNIDKYKDKNYIDTNNETVKDVLNSVQKANNVNGIQEIKSILENGTEEKVRGLQMKLWTPTNNLMITGKIDEQTAKILKGYIENDNNKKDKPSETLNYCALSGYKEINNIKIDGNTGWTGGSTYEMTGEYGDKSYMFKGYKVDGNTKKTFIASNVECATDGNNNVVKIGANTIIQYSDGTKDVYTNGVLAQYDSAGNKIENPNNGQGNTGQTNPENGNNAENNAGAPENQNNTTNGGVNNPTQAPATEGGNNVANNTNTGAPAAKPTTAS